MNRINGIKGGLDQSFLRFILFKLGENILKDFKKYRRTQIAEMRPYEKGEKLSGIVSVSKADIENGSPKEGDMIARNPKDHEDQWLVAEKYFKDNFEPVEEK